jgi:hypothetical protein
MTPTNERLLPAASSLGGLGLGHLEVEPAFRNTEDASPFAGKLPRSRLPVHVARVPLSVSDLAICNS